MLDLSTESLEKLIKLLECQAATNNALHELVMQMNEKQKELEKVISTQMVNLVDKIQQISILEDIFFKKPKDNSDEKTS